MRRADRLFAIIQLLRGRRVVTARTIADQLRVSERTIYRDIRDLTLSGVPVEGEAGVGYAIRGGYDLPPLMFTEKEIAAMVIGARMVHAWGGTAHSQGAALALSKIEAVLPGALRASIAETRVFSPAMFLPPEIKELLDTAHGAIDGRQRLKLRYRDETGKKTHRTIRPLGLFYWGKVWTLAAWCELRDDFRTFRLDRIETATVRKKTFLAEEGKTLEDFIASRRRA